MIALAHVWCWRQLVRDPLATRSATARASSEINREPARGAVSVAIRVPFERPAPQRAASAILINYVRGL
jgi:hypothetical protein